MPWIIEPVNTLPTARVAIHAMVVNQPVSSVNLDVQFLGNEQIKDFEDICHGRDIPVI